MKKLLEVKNLSTSFYTHLGEVQAVRNISFSLNEGDVLGIVGESGSGKSVTALSIMRLIGIPGEIKAGKITEVYTDSYFNAKRTLKDMETSFTYIDTLPKVTVERIAEWRDGLWSYRITDGETVVFKTSFREVDAYLNYNCYGKCVSFDIEEIKYLNE